MTLFKKTLALLLCLAMALSVVACGGEEPDPTVDLDAIEETMAEGDKDCVHAWDEWEEYEESTCSADGIAIRTCTLCGGQESQILPAYGHDVSDGKCLDCGKKIKKCDHEDTDIVVIKAATCTEKGKEHEVCTACMTILDEEKIPALGHDMVEYQYKDATCTENGWYRHEVCSNCGLNDREEIAAYGHSMRAGTCSTCGYIDPEFQILSAPGMTEVATTITLPEVTTYAASAAQVTSEVGQFAEKDQIIEYKLTAAVTGYYRIWFTEVYSGNKYDVYVYNSLGERVKYGTWMGNNEGITAELTGGAEYSIQVKHRSGDPFSYQINVGFQKALVDISSYGVVTDSITYTDEAVVYTFTPTVEGTYRFQLSDMMADLKVDMYIYNYLGERVSYDTYCGNGGGLTVKNFVANQTYTIYIFERSNLGAFTLNIHKPSASTDVSGFNTVYDSTRYVDQINVYTFTATSKNMTLLVNGMGSDSKVDLYLYNRLGEYVDYETYCYNGDGFKVTNLTVGETYTINVKYRSGAAEYALRLYTGKDPIDVSSNMGISDVMEYDGQVNTYILTVDVAGPHTVMMASAGDYDCLSVAVYNANGTLIAEDYYMYAGDYLTLGDLAVGDQLTIVVTEYDTCSYTLAIQ